MLPNFWFVLELAFLLELSSSFSFVLFLFPLLTLAFFFFLFFLFFVKFGLKNEKVVVEVGEIEKKTTVFIAKCEDTEITLKPMCTKIMMRLCFSLIFLLLCPFLSPYYPRRVQGSEIDLLWCCLDQHSRGLEL